MGCVFYAPVLRMENSPRQYPSPVWHWHDPFRLLAGHTELRVCMNELSSVEFLPGARNVSILEASNTEVSPLHGDLRLFAPTREHLTLQLVDCTVQVEALISVSRQRGR